MLIRWGNFDDAFDAMEQFQRQLARITGEYGTRGLFLPEEWADGWPRITTSDTGSAFVVRGEVPGLGQDDIHISVSQNVLTISGERKPDIPEGYLVHRRERPALRFSRSFSLGAKVDLEKCTATVKDGVVTVTLPKMPESQPRQIAVKPA